MVQNAYGYGLFTGGRGVQAGTYELSCGVILIGGDTARQIEFLSALNPAVLTYTPSYALYIAETARERGVDTCELPVSTMVIGAEPFTEPMRAEIEAELGVTAVDIYGLSEIIGLGVSVECVEAQDGRHVWDDYFLPEVIAPETGAPVPEGEPGELVLTTLAKEALPDRSRHHAHPRALPVWSDPRADGQRPSPDRCPPRRPWSQRLSLSDRGRFARSRRRCPTVPHRPPARGSS
jgi:phenylacetate-CoA ligase